MAFILSLIGFGVITLVSVTLLNTKRSTLTDRLLGAGVVISLVSLYLSLNQM